MNVKGATLWAAQSVAVILALFAAGVLASIMVISEQVQSPLWLPAAIGVAAAVWMGKRAIPALFIGAGLLGSGLARREGLELQPILMVGLATGASGTLQALAGRYLILRFINARAEVETARDYARLILIGPVAGLVSPSISLPVQALAGIWHWDDWANLALIWTNWWLGNAVAIALLTPLLLGVRRRSPAQVAIVFSIVVIGLIASYKVGVATATQAQSAWENQARFDASQLTDIFISALRNGYGDMRALALLFDDDHVVNENRFRVAVATLEDNREGFAPAALLVARRHGGDDWIVDFASDNELGLVQGYNLSELPVARDAIDTSLGIGLTLGGTTELLPGRYFGFNAIPAANSTETTVIVGVQDVSEIDRIVAEEIPYGLGFAIASVHASGLTTEGRDHLYPQGTDSSDAVASVVIPRTTGGATLTFRWGVVPEYLGGPALGFSRAIAFGAPLVTLLVAVFINMLFAQAGRIRNQVARQTAALQQQKAIATLALENMGEGLLLVDEHGKVAAYNQIAAEYFGMTDEEIRRFPVYEELLRYMYVDKYQQPEELEVRLEELRRNEAFTTYRTLPNGNILETRNNPVAGGGFVRVYLDVTDIRKAAAELERQRAIADLALENMDEGILLVEENGQLGACNRFAMELFGVTQEEYDACSTYEEVVRFVYSEKLETPELIEGVLAEARGKEMHVHERARPDGRILETRHMPMENGGFVRMFTDITERRQTQKQLQEAKQIAEESARSKSEFLANMSHEIRTPMNAIIGMSQLALKTELTPKQHNYIDKVHRSAVGLLGIINDILDFSKIEAGKLDLESIDFRLEDVLDNLANLVGLRAEEKGLELLLDVDATVPRQLVGDPLRLGQVLVNLGNNAVKFTDSGEIVVSVRVEEKSDETVTLSFSIRDTGIGMTAEQQSKLFQAFSQADASTTRKYGGTGLGLTISERLVDAMQGEISVHSEPGAGSDFRFTTQLGWKPEQDSLPQAKELDLDKLHVLVVDDNATARVILQDIVTSLGFRVDMAASGEEALALAASAQNSTDPYTVVLMDWQMPKMDGVATTRALMDRGLLASTQSLLMVTAFGREEAAAAGAGLPIDGYLTKPLNASTLLDSILVAHGREGVSQRRRQRGEDATGSIQKLAGAHILLVEDNEINQELALELLTDAGIRADVANNGQEALDALASCDYDGVLLDIQMPVMDGYTAAAEVRKQERFKDLPVIAMTANAMVGDREKAAAAGMNDHIAKPLDVNEMFATMARWITPSRPGAQPDAIPAPVPETSSIAPMAGIDIDAGLAICAANVDLYRRLLTKFLAANAEFANKFREAQGDDDADAATRLAHTLKGVAGNIGAREASTAAGVLEAACRAGESDDLIREHMARLTDALAPVLEAIAQADLSAAPEEGGAATPPLDMGRAIAHLRELLEDADTSAREAAEELLQITDTATRESIDKLIAQIDIYEFDEALSVLTEAEPGLLGSGGQVS